MGNKFGLLAVGLIVAGAVHAAPATIGLSASFLLAETLAVDLRKPIKVLPTAPVPGNGGEVVVEDPEALLLLEDLGDQIELPQNLLAIEFNSNLKQKREVKFEVEFFIEAIAAKLRDGTYGAAIVNGCDLPYLQKKHPNVRILAFLNNYRDVKTHIVIRARDEWGGMATLRDLRTEVARPSFAATLWLESEFRRVSGKAGGLLRPFPDMQENAHGALDNMLLWKSDAVVIDAASLENYRNNYPGRFRGLKIVETSPASPLPALVYDQTRFDARFIEAIEASFFGAKPPMNVVSGYMLGLNYPRRPDAKDAELIRSLPAGDGEPFRHRAVRLFDRK